MAEKGMADQHETLSLSLSHSAGNVNGRLTINSLSIKFLHKLHYCAIDDDNSGGCRGSKMVTVL